jgi:hypothetical protein
MHTYIQGVECDRYPLFRNDDPGKRICISRKGERGEEMVNGMVCAAGCLCTAGVGRSYMSPPYHGGGYILSETQAAVCPQHSPCIGWTAGTPATIAATQGVQEGHIGSRYAVSVAGAHILDLEGSALALPSNRLACQALTGTAATATTDASYGSTFVFVSVVA